MHVCRKLGKVYLIGKVLHFLSIDPFTSIAAGRFAECRWEYTEPVEPGCTLTASIRELAALAALGGLAARPA
jgi:hypothetical protein